jgi:hypothetical protein
VKREAMTADMGQSKALHFVGLAVGEDIICIRESDGEGYSIANCFEKAGYLFLIKTGALTYLNDCPAS